MGRRIRWEERTSWLKGWREEDELGMVIKWEDGRIWWDDWVGKGRIWVEGLGGKK